MSISTTGLATSAERDIRLQVEKISLHYQTGTAAQRSTFKALDNVSLDVFDNEFAVIVGPSGCGKSSLLYLTAGLNRATSGTISVSGKPVSKPGPDRGMVFQSYTLFPWLTVAQNIEFGLKRRNIPEAIRREQVAGFIREVGLEQFADSYPKQLSGGMMQRVAIARALANDPEIILMDEPFGALDSQTRMQMQNMLMRIWEQKKKTVVFVTHDIDEAILLADRIFVMAARPGRIREIIPVDLPRPRRMDLSLTPEFMELKKRVFTLLEHDLHL